MNYASPILKLDNAQNNIYIKRDDLLPFAFGGNKLRIAEEFYTDMELKKANCIVGYGSSRSNLSRILSAIASCKGYPCYIISPSDDDGSRLLTNNSRLVAISGASVIPCQKDNVENTVRLVLSQCISNGLRPYYIYGDPTGSGNEAIPVGAYVKGAEEISKQEKELGISFDRIYFASGTGMTQSGLIVGKQLLQKNWEIYGISIARTKERGEESIKKYIDKYYEEHCLIKPLDYSIHFLDNYLLGGYGKYDSRITNIINSVYNTYGISLDTTYTGKAFWGMMEHLTTEGIEGSNVLFIHTGGTPLFFDSIAYDNLK